MTKRKLVRKKAGRKSMFDDKIIIRTSITLHATTYKLIQNKYGMARIDAGYFRMLAENDVEKIKKLYGVE